MVQPLPPPPPPRPDTSSWQGGVPIPPPARPRPQLVTAAGVTLIVLGAVQGFTGVMLLVLSPADLSRLGSIGNMDLAPVARGIGLFSLVVGALEILAGVLVLRLSEGGRVFGIVVAAFGAFGGFASVLNGSVAGVLTLGCYAFVIYVLFSQREAFRGTRQG
jgi:hypothetical protein